MKIVLHETGVSAFCTLMAKYVAFRKKSPDSWKMPFIFLKSAIHVALWNSFDCIPLQDKIDGSITNSQLGQPNKYDFVSMYIQAVVIDKVFPA